MRSSFSVQITDTFDERTDARRRDSAAGIYSQSCRHLFLRGVNEAAVRPPVKQQRLMTRLQVQQKTISETGDRLFESKDYTKARPPH